MNILLSILSGLLIGLTTTLYIVWRQLSCGGRQLPVTAEWIEDLSADRYRPMLRLLDASELKFLSAQPGFDGKMMSRLRTQRCQIFGGYLKCLNADFQRTCSALKLVLMQSRYDRPDLASTLLAAQFRFALGLAVVRCRLALYRIGMGSVDVRELVKLFDGMRVELRMVMPYTAASAA